MYHCTYLLWLGKVRSENSDSKSPADLTPFMSENRRQEPNTNFSDHHRTHRQQQQVSKTPDEPQQLQEKRPKQQGKRPVCKYGAKCYRKNPDHRRQVHTHIKSVRETKKK